MLSKFIFILMLVLGLTVSIEPVSTPNVAAATKTAIEQQHATTHRIGVYSMLQGEAFNSEVGHCSATVVGPHAILTAQHCFLDQILASASPSL
jgi:V8-like Glu-specific endopeptidase